MMEKREESTARILARARGLGFVAAGVAAVEPMDAAPLAAWLARGYGAEMDYLQRHLPLRADLTAVLPGARTVVCVALPYPGPGAGDDPPTGAIARYARGADYHTVIKERLEELWQELRSDYPDAMGRVFVDGGPLPERELARRAGLGWIGSHGSLITPQAGSCVLLGELLTTLDLAPTAPISGGCGACRRCLDACPTGALAEPGIVDARRCLSYLTIEHQGPIPRELRVRLGTRLFGCDACQDTCPHNRGVGEGDAAFAAAPDLAAPDLAAILAMTPAALNRRFRGTPMQRAKRRGLLRNACIALGNQGDPAALPALAGALCDEEPLVRGHAVWAIGRLGGWALLENALPKERDRWVREEMLAALAMKNGEA